MTREFDGARAEAFAGRLVQVFNDGALSLMLSVGHRTGLFDAMREAPGPETSADLAARAGLQERYVREWLGAIVTGGVVDYDPEARTYRLPAEHAAALTRAAGADNLAAVAQYIGCLGGVEDAIVDRFRRGGGVPYEAFPRFHEIMAEDSGQSVLASLDDHILPLVDGLVERLEQGIRVADLGCGRGLVVRHLAERFPNSRFTGIDLSAEAIAWARERAGHLPNLAYVTRDLRHFDRTTEPEVWDLITTFDAVHDQPFPLNLLRGIRRALAPDGVYLMQDINGSSHVHRDVDHPLGTLLYTISCMHCMTVSLAQGGEGVGAMWGEEMTRDYLTRAGFRSITTNRLAHDLQNNWYVVRT